jgi:hypothetical protein
MPNDPLGVVEDRGAGVVEVAGGSPVEYGLEAGAADAAPALDPAVPGGP